MGLLEINNINLYKILFYLIIYSSLGWLLEVAYAYKNQKRFVNRGFLQGPICPIYGFCCLSLMHLLYLFNIKNLFILFIVATFTTSFIEYSTSYILEKLLNKRYWDYTEDPLNINGRICVHFSLMWGVLAVFTYKVIHPFIEAFVSQIPPFMAALIFYSILLTLIVDIFITLNSLVQFKKLSNYINWSKYFDLHILRQNYLENIIKKIKRP